MITVPALSAFPSLGEGPGKPGRGRWWRLFGMAEGVDGLIVPRMTATHVTHASGRAGSDLAQAAVDCTPGRSTLNP